MNLKVILRFLTNKSQCKFEFLIVVFLKIQVLWNMMPKTLLSLLGPCSAGIRLF